MDRMDKSKRAAPVIEGGNGKVAAEDLLHAFGGGSKVRVFVTPGKDVLELLMRTNFESKDQMVAAVLLFDKCARFNFQRGLDDLKAFLAGLCSIQGRSTALALQAEVGMVVPGVLAKDMDWRALRRKGKPDEHQRPYPEPE